MNPNEPTSTQHTPGPWTRDFGNYIYAGTQEQVVTGQAKLLATCLPLDNSRPHWEQAFANARLISAAPDLHGALRALVIAHTPATDWTNEEESIICEYRLDDAFTTTQTLKRIVEYARGALAKAEGRPL